jgi:pimeloyl-ACP methyl ester carboxylesterase
MDQDLEELVTHRMLDVGEVRLHAVEAGSGPLVVLLHGFPEFWYSWRNQIPALAAAGYRVVAPDLRGYGLSDKPKGLDAYRASTLTGDIAGLIAALGEERATVVGHDWGGSVAWLTAMLRPEVVERLVVCNTPHPADFSRALRDPVQALRSSYILALQLPVLPEVALSAGRAAAIRGLLRAATVRHDAFSEADLARYAEIFGEPENLRGPLAYYRASARSFARRRSGPTQRPRVVTAPTLILWGQRDRVLGPELAEPGLDLVPDRRVERFEEAGHFVHADAPDRVNRHLVEFLAGGA